MISRTDAGETGQHVTGVSGFHAQEKKESQRFALHLFG
jgi:hypothetical protein